MENAYRWGSPFRSFRIQYDKKNELFQEESETFLFLHINETYSWGQTRK